jgi:GT2 family glycosyltransferase
MDASAPAPAATIAVVPRESFSRTRHTLERLLAGLEPGTRVVCVDGGSPAPVRRYLERMAQQHDLALLRADHFLSPNQARNLALPLVDTEYVAFVDFETETEPGWLDRLLACARSTGASIVGPVYHERRGDRVLVHMAGGEAHVVDNGSTRWFRETHRHHGVSPGTLPPMAAAPTEQVEFHCMLVRRDVFDLLGPLDEELLSIREHSDLCLAVREHGGSVYLEPNTCVAYAPPRWFFHWADLRYWLVRWSDGWNVASLDHFVAKWHLSDDDPEIDGQLAWARAQRRVCYRPWLSILSRAFGRHRGAVYDWIDPRAQRAALAHHRARIAHAGAPRTVHAPSWAHTVARGG